ncbi:MAG: SH3 domain-containing protein [Flavobacteriaceae bacterium]|nr:SH3 domain-containing protein [Bacteroidia bacterium]NNK88009.1 SH3 domain-containing protein [Flavobacteriaceae bacterium]
MKNLLLFVIPLLINFSANAQSQQYVAAENGLFTRVSPDRGARSLMKLNYGTKVEIIERTGLRLDILDGGEKVSGEWVRVNAYTPYDLVQGYVFDAYLTAEVLEPTSVVNFENITLTFHNLELWETESQSWEAKQNKIKYYTELGVTPENKKITINVKIPYKRLAIYQAYETSVSIMNEGPHCDLLDWKHFHSTWIPIKYEADHYFTLGYDQKDWTKFVPFEIEELKAEVREHCGEEYLRLIENPEGSNSAASISISTIYIKIVMIDMNDNPIERIIAFEIPMGC